MDGTLDSDGEDTDIRVAEAGITCVRHSIAIPIIAGDDLKIAECVDTPVDDKTRLSVGANRVERPLVWRLQLDSSI